MTTDQPTVIGGRYELSGMLGRGGMAEVREGIDTRLGRKVAVKRLRTDLASDPTFQARFRREAQSSASLNHPSIVAVYDTGEEIVEDSGQSIGQPYIVMEYVAGRTLRDVLREGRKILPERALEITAGVLSALDYSHRAGIIHRDIKPANVMLTPSGDVKVMDFGIARAVSDASSTMTQTAAVVGTAQYLSPEQARGENVDSRSDVYSTGCLLFELLTGRPPFVGESPVAVAYQHVREPAVPPSSFDAELDPQVDRIVMKALTKRVEDRYQSAAAMRADIDRYLAGRPVQAPEVVAPDTMVVPATAMAGPYNTSATAAVPMVEDDQPRRRAPWILVLLLLIALIGAMAYFVPKLLAGDEEIPRVQVPRVVNMLEERAVAAIEDAELEAEVVRVADSDVARGRVISTDPDADEYVDEGTTVTLTVSSGPPQARVPDVTDRDVEDAKALLKAAGFKWDVKTRESDEDAGWVIDQNPQANVSVREGRVITLYVSDGKEQVPDLTGMTEAEARRALVANGFKLGEVTHVTTPTEAEAGTVVDQFPGAGQEAPEDTEVDIQITDYVEPEPSETPTPTDTTSPTDTPILPLP